MYEAKAVPPPAPGLSDAASLEHDVVNARPRELVADDQPGLTTADDDRVNPLAQVPTSSQSPRVAGYDVAL